MTHNIKYSQLWSLQYERLWAMHGSVIIDSNCFMAVGEPNGDAKIYKIDLRNGDLSCYVDFRKNRHNLPNEEMQGISYYNEEFYFSTTYGLY